MYCSASLALAALEYLVHVDAADAPADLVALEIAVPDSLALQTQSLASLPALWRATSVPMSCRVIGDTWIAAGQSIGLVVPSVIIPVEQNLLLNPAHPAMARVAVMSAESFVFDPRLLYRPE